MSAEEEAFRVDLAPFLNEQTTKQGEAPSCHVATCGSQAIVIARSEAPGST